MNSTHNDLLNISKQTPFRSGIAASRKKKAHALVAKIADKSKKINRAMEYNQKLKKKGKKMSLKKRANRGESSKAVAAFKAIAAKKLKNKDKRKLNKSLYEATHD